MRLLTRFALAAFLVAGLVACDSPTDRRDDSRPPTRTDGGSSDGGGIDGGGADAGVTDGGSEECSDGWGDCTAAAGCETNVLTSNDHCGGCNNPCSGTCTNGQCQQGSPGIEICVFDGASLVECVPPQTALTIEFGKPASGMLARRTLEIRSIGTGTVEVAGPAFSGAADFSATPNPYSARIAPGEKSQLNLTFGALASGRREATLILSTNVPGAETLSIALGGGDPPANCVLAATTTSIDFGPVGVLTTATLTITLESRGTSACELAVLPDIINGTGGRFEVPTFGLPLSIAGGSSYSFTVKYTPQDGTGPDQADVRVRYIAGGIQKALTVSVFGAPVVNPECILDVTPAPGLLSFDGVAVNTTRSLPVTFTNRGSINCTLSNARIAAAAFGTTAVFTVSTPPAATLAPNASTTMMVSFTPTSKTVYGAKTQDVFYGVNVNVDTSDPTRFSGGSCTIGWTSGSAGCVGWMLYGEGADISLGAYPAQINFGTVKTGCRSPQSKVTLSAPGAPVNVTAVRIEPPSLASVFSVTVGSVPFTVNGGGTKDLPIRFIPSAATSYSATLVIEHSGGTALNIPLAGSGTMQSSLTESYIVNGKSDVLFMVDDSGSMSEEQFLLSSAASDFVTAANGLNANFQIAVVTSDMDLASKSGSFQGAPKIVTSSDPSAASKFGSTVQALGTAGSANEKGLEAVYTALSAPLITDPLKNGGFLRPDANLDVVIVSDEDDFSTRSTAEYIAFLKSLKGNRKATLHAIVGEAGGCSSTNGTADEGLRYLAVQSATGGIFRSICGTNWTPYVQAIALQAFALQKSFTMSQPVTVGSYVVKINGSTVSSANYTFDPATYTITLNTTPPAGATVTIEYTPVCMP